MLKDIAPAEQEEGWVRRGTESGGVLSTQGAVEIK